MNVMIQQHPTRPGAFQVTAQQHVGASIEKVFEFFSDAHQLETLTPPWLHFSVQTPQPIEMHEGVEIDYHLRMHGLPMRWRSRISVWEPPYRFVDEQEIGPYKFWHHEHKFMANSEKDTLVIDIVDYQVRGGRLVNWLFVKRDLLRIFCYRQKVLGGIFQSGKQSPPLPHDEAADIRQR